MYCRFKCDNCGEWHPLDQFTLKDLKTFMMLCMVQPFEPFTTREWLLIISAEVTRRMR